MTIPVTMHVGVWEEPDLRFTQAGKPWVTIPAIYKDRRRNQGGEYEDSSPMFVRVKAFGDIAENIAESVHRGDQILVVGRLQPDEYEKDGQKRTTYDLLVDEIGLSLRWAKYVKEQAGDMSHGPSRQAEPQGWRDEGGAPPF